MAQIRERVLSVYIRLQYLYVLFNKTLTQCAFPSQWTHPNLTPIFRKGDKTLISNYRPISLNSVFGNRFERLVFLQNILKKYRSGFTTSHSTTFQFITFFIIKTDKKTVHLSLASLQLT